ncbi:rhizobiocin [Agrobacterium larrymoorei]|uniref:rhizobiocin n=1 Tax=Agrobacterium larrymoorei TaxID=160699 RepID=UPI0030BCBCFD
MAFTVQFGNGGAATVADLKAAESTVNGLLTDGTGAETNDLGQSFPISTVNVKGGGKVDVAFDTSITGFSFDVAGAWNSVKNVLAVSDEAQTIKVKDFVHADILLGGNGNSTVEVLNVKRGNIETGAGNDNVHISLLSNSTAWVNDTVIKTGAGNDNIVITQGQSLKDIGGIVNANGSNGGNGVTDGSSTTVYIDAGDGNDMINLSAVTLKSSTVIGGKGSDVMYASHGADTFVFNLGDMTTSAFTTDKVIGFDVNSDKLDLKGSVTDWKFGEFEDSTVLTYKGAGDHFNEKIVLVGVVLDAAPSSWLFA